MSNVWSLSSTFIAMTLLALSYFGHYRSVLAQTPSLRQQRMLQIAGWALLALSCWWCIRADGGGYGVMVWFGSIAICALIIMMLISFRPTWLPASIAAVLISNLLAIFLTLV